MTSVLLTATLIISRYPIAADGFSEVPLILKRPQSGPQRLSKLTRILHPAGKRDLNPRSSVYSPESDSVRLSLACLIYPRNAAETR